LVRKNAITKKARVFDFGRAKEKQKSKRKTRERFNGKMVTKEKLLDLFEYKDGELYWKVKRKGILKSKKAGYLSNNYILVMVDGKNYPLHRLVFLMINGFLPNLIDHIDGNPLNNTIENLREATKSENNCNAKARCTNGTNIKNVVFVKEKRKYKVQITKDSKYIFIGYFNDIELAELAAIEARQKYHKQFARV
jgi:hypothetical protein